MSYFGTPMQTLLLDVTVSTGAFSHKSSSKGNEVKEGGKKGLLGGFKEKINTRNIKTSQFREEVLLFPLMKEEL